LKTGDHKMRLRHAPIWTMLAFMLSLAPGIGRAADDIGWPEAVDRLAGEKSKALTCAALLKKYGGTHQISQGELAYGEAKANFDGVIAGLITALGEGENPKSLPSLETELEHGAAGLKAFCQPVSNVVPKSSGHKDWVTDLATGGLQPVIDALKEGVGALYNDHRKDDALVKETIKTQLEASRWPDFAKVEAAP
jgi:hypothetical protein